MLFRSKPLASVLETKPAVDEKKLDALTKAADPIPPPSKPGPEAGSVDLSKADEKLSALLGKPKS